MRHHTRPPRTRTASSPSSHVRPAPRRDRVGTAPHRDEAGAVAGLAVDVRWDLGRPLVTVAGELDASGAGLLTAVLEHVLRDPHAPGGSRPPRDTVDLDLGRVTAADVDGLGAVLDGRTRVVAASAPVRRAGALLQDAEAICPQPLT